MTQIARYFASLGVDVDNSQLRKVDAYLKSVERKMVNFGRRMNKLPSTALNIRINVNTTALLASVRNAMKMASNVAVLRISKFTIDQAELRRQVQAAMRGLRNAAGNMRLSINLDVAVGNGLRNQIRTIVINAVRDAMRGGGGGPGPNPGGGRGHLGNAGAVGAGSLLARSMAPLLALGAGGYGLSQLNQKNQEVISAQLTTMAVTEAAGLKGQGPEAFEWLRGQGNRIGFNYVDQAQDYNNFLSNSLGAGESLEASQETYLGFAEYSKAMGVTAPRQKLIMNALSQMTGKGTISMEELKRQMAESLPGTMSIFAEAYQKSIGGDKSGQGAIADLLKAVPEGKLKSSEIIPLVAEIMRERAKPKLDIASKTSASEQARFQNMASDSAIAAGTAGVEEGFARLFKTLTTSLKEAAPLINSMAAGFNEFTKKFAFLALMPQSIQRAMDGRDSYIADVLGKENTKIVADMLNSFKETTSEITETLKNAFAGWGQILGTIGPEIMSFMSTLSDIFLYTFKMLNQVIAGNIVGKGGAADAGRALQHRLAGGTREEAAKIALGEDIEEKSTTDKITGAASFLSKLSPTSAIANYIAAPIGEAVKGVGPWMDTYRKPVANTLPNAGTIDALGYKQVDMTGIQPMPRLSGPGVPQPGKVDMAGMGMIPMPEADPNKQNNSLLSLLQEKFSAAGQVTNNNSMSVNLVVDASMLGTDVNTQAQGLADAIEQAWNDKMRALGTVFSDNSN